MREAGREILAAFLACMRLPAPIPTLQKDDGPNHVSLTAAIGTVQRLQCHIPTTIHVLRQLTSPSLIQLVQPVLQDALQESVHEFAHCPRKACALQPVGATAKTHFDRQQALPYSCCYTCSTALCNAIAGGQPCMCCSCHTNSCTQHPICNSAALAVPNCTVRAQPHCNNMPCDLLLFQPYDKLSTAE
jgi:hypothetical protein